MTTLIISATHDFSGDTLSNVNDIVYTNSGAATATFVSGQFDGTHIATNSLVTGDGNVNDLTVNGSSQFVDLSLLQFSSWTAATDIITINGTDGTANNLKGSR